MPRFSPGILRLLLICMLCFPVSSVCAENNDKVLDDETRYDIPLDDKSVDENAVDDQAKKNNWRPEVAESRQDVQTSKSVIEEVKSKEPFINIQQERQWDFSQEDDEETDSDFNPDLLWLGGLINFLAVIVEAAFWIIPLLVLLYLYRYRDVCMNLVQGKGFKRTQTEIPDTLFGLDMRQKSLPDNIEKESMLLWQDKKYREAVSLLYRGSLVSLFEQYRFELAPGATEQDCVRQIDLSEKNQQNINTHANKDLPADSKGVNTQQRISHFKRLTNIWIEIAYAHRMPTEERFQAVCDGWNENFSENRKNR